MYAKKYRLHIQKHSMPAESSILLAHFSAKIASSASEHNRFAVVIPAASVKKATRRNFWRRVVADHIKQWPNAKKDFRIYVSRGIEEISRSDAEKELDKIFAKAVPQK